MRGKALLGLVAGFLVALPASQSAHAQTAQPVRTFVSGVGDDSNTCSRTAPCKTFAIAIFKTAANGEIDCLDPGGFGTVTIAKSITIDCTGTLGSVLASGVNGFNISVPVTDGDPLATVRLRGLTINGTGASGTAGTRTGHIGISINQAATVIIEDSVISDFTQQGVLDQRIAGAGKLLIRNSVIRNNTGAGIVIAATGGGTRASIENVHSVNNGFGIAVASGNKVAITRSVFSGNTTVGVEADAGGSIGLDATTVSGNTLGLQTGGSILFSNSNIIFNNTAISGPTISFGNNRIFGNLAAGTAPAVVGQQ